MSGTVADVIRVAEGELGNTDGAKYFAAFDTPDLGPWCVAFVRWCMKRAGVPFDWNTWYAWDWSDAPDPIAPHDLRVGDAVSFDWGADGGGDHVGIVKSVHDWGISTIEGNTSGGTVAERERVWSVVICGIRPTYKAGGAGWVKSGERWWYRHADGSYTTDGWEFISGHWYYFDHDGWMRTGWVQDNGKWYFCDRTKGATEGQMLASTCVQDGDAWYALGESGAMLTDVRTNPDHDGTYGRLIL